MYTQEAVESGKYEKREVTKPTYFTPSGQFIPGLGERVPPNSFNVSWVKMFLASNRLVLVLVLVLVLTKRRWLLSIMYYY